MLVDIAPIPGVSEKYRCLICHAVKIAQACSFTQI